MGQLGDALRPGDHVCWTVDGPAHRRDAVSALVSTGLDAGDMVLCVTDREVPVPAAVQVIPARSGDRFDARRMLDLVGENIDKAHAAGYPGLRVVGELDCALADPPALDELTWYEERVTALFVTGQALGVCLYDRRAVGRATLWSLACAHPGTATDNPTGGWTPLLRSERTAEPYGLRLCGEVDLSNRQALAATLAVVVDERPDPAVPVVVDLSGLRFIDAGTVGVLVRTALAAPAGVRLTGCHGEVAVVLERLGVPQMPGVLVTAR